MMSNARWGGDRHNAKKMTTPIALENWLKALLHPLTRRIGLIDVGSGGPLKEPWSRIPERHLVKRDFDPETASGGTQMPICISDRSGVAKFNIAADPRASSLHEAAPEFIERFAMSSLALDRQVEVQLTTLDATFLSQAAEIDFIDINVEGHDYQVLKGSDSLLRSAFIKVLKIEFELAQVWHGQGWFSDIDGELRARGFELVDLEIDRIVPATAREFRIGAEPVWGKAVYLPGAAAWQRHRTAHLPKRVSEDSLIGIAGAIAADRPARAIDIARMAESLPQDGSGLKLPTAVQLSDSLRDLYVSPAKQAWRRLPLPLRAALSPLLHLLAIR